MAHAHDDAPLAPADDPNEVFDVVDDHDHVIGQARRGKVHRDPALMHRSVQVLVFDHADRLLLQRRSQAKDLFPGYLCASASGHVAAGEGYAHTAEREVAEELGVSLALTYIGKLIVRSSVETEMTAVFVARSDGPFSFHPTETEGGAFISQADLARGRAAGELPLTPALEAALELIERTDSVAHPGTSGI